MPSGIIVKGIGGFYYVEVENGLYECKARGVFRKDNLTPLPGDRVNFSIVDEEKMKGNIDEILQRKSELIRPAVANVNQVAVVVAIKSPNPDFILLDKLLITSEVKGLDIVICINKVDLDLGDGCNKIIDAYTKSGYTVIPLSTKADIGFDKLAEALAGRVTVFAGQSGVGKSTILNRVMNSSIMETGEVSGKIERGKHTTRHAELVGLEGGGYVVDTPGFSSYELTDIAYEELEIYYPEFAAHLNKCKFTGCSHISEPECSVKQALERGEMDTERYERYVQFYTALKANKSYSSKEKAKSRRK